MNGCISANFAILGMFFGSHSTILMQGTIFAFITKSKNCIFWTRILSRCSNKVRTPNKMQTVTDKMHLVSAYLQDASCQQQFAT